MGDINEKSSDARYVATLDYLRKLCSTREYCRRDMHDKALKRLQKAAGDAVSGDAVAGDAVAGYAVAGDALCRNQALQIVDALVQEGFVDETRYAAAFARDKSSIQGWGPAKIRMALSAKGVPADIISDALSCIDDNKADAKLLKSLEIKAKQLSGDPQIRLKLLRFALGRGYSYEQINVKICEILNKNS